MIEKCAKCSSEKVIPQAKVIDRGDNNLAGDLRVAVDEKPDAFFFKQRAYSDVIAKICGECGFTEFYVNDPKSLWIAYENQNSPQ